MSSKLRQHYEDTEQALIAEGQRAGVLTSSTSIGRAREIVINGFLSDHLPKRVAVERGELIDSHDRSSGELDTILVDHDSMAWRIGGESLVPVEATPGVLEVKSSLSGKNLEDALRKVARVKSLTRVSSGGFYDSGAEGILVPVPPPHTNGYIIAFDGPSWEHIGEQLVAHPEWYEDDFLTYGPELICILGKGFAHKNDNHILGVPEGTSALVTHRPVPGLEALTLHIQETLRRYGTLSYQLTLYFGGG
jgi:hypothetical protein